MHRRFEMTEMILSAIMSNAAIFIVGVVLINKLSSALAWYFAPLQRIRLAKANAKAKRIYEDTDA